MKKIVLMFVFFYGISEAGMFNKMVEYGKDKAKDMAIEEAKNSYSNYREEKRKIEYKTNKKSALTHLEDGYGNAKNEVKESVKSKFKVKN